MRNILILLLSLATFSCVVETNKVARDGSELFPSIYEDKRCLPSVSQYEPPFKRYTIRFDAEGYRSFGFAYYDDENCRSYITQEDSFLSTYPYEIGAVVTNQDGSSGTSLLFPDPEDAGPYGTVFILYTDELCFAEGTINISEYSFGFTPVDNEGDFSGLDIDTNNCWRDISDV